MTNAGTSGDTINDHVERMSQAVAENPELNGKCINGRKARHGSSNGRLAGHRYRNDDCDITALTVNIPGSILFYMETGGPSVCDHGGRRPGRWIDFGV